MARIPFVASDALVEPARSLVEGHPIALYKTLANSPGGLEHFAALGSWIRYGARLDPRQRELAILAVGALARCDYEFSHHVKIGRDFGVSDDDIRQLLAACRGEPSSFEGSDRLLIDAAREITVEGKLAAATYDALARSFDDEALVEIVLIIAHYACVVRVLESLEIEVEPEYRGYLEEFPLHP